MCIVTNPVGSLSVLKSKLHENQIYDFSSINEVIRFRDSYLNIKQQIILHHERRIENEIVDLNLKQEQLKREIEIIVEETKHKLLDQRTQIQNRLDKNNSQRTGHFFKWLLIPIQNLYLNKKLKSFDSNFNIEIEKSYKAQSIQLEEILNRFQFVSNQFDIAVYESAKNDLNQHLRKKRIVDELNPFILGAIGENKVVKELEHLSNEYYLINDFSTSFSKPIYNKKENEYIQSIQIDHILIGPSGVFIIETKNWSQESIENEKLWSPVKQIKRASYVLFLLLNSDNSAIRNGLTKHQWGNKNISIKNLLVFINNAPNTNFQFVKVLNLREIIGYVKYFQPLWTVNEVKSIANFLLDINEK